MIYGERIRFRHMERTDLPRFVDYLNDPEVNWGLAVYLPLSMAAEEQWFVNMLKRPPAEQPLAIEVRAADPAGGSDTWKLVGNCALLDIDWRNRSAELGILIGDKRLLGARVRQRGDASAGQARLRDAEPAPRSGRGCTRPTRAPFAPMRRPALSWKGASARLRSRTASISTCW